MRRSLVGWLSLSFCIVCCSPTPKPPVGPAAGAVAPEQPLYELPYTPSLDRTAMEPGADPCVDFYRYSCGGWQKHNPLPGDESSWSVYGKLSKENQRYLWGILDRAAHVEGGDANERKLGEFFGSCMDEAAVEKAGAAPLATALNAIAALRTYDDLAAYLGRSVRETGGSLLFGFASSQDFDDANSVIAFAVASGLGLPDRDYYVLTDDKSKEIRERYVQHVARMLGLLGGSPESGAAQAREIMAIETALAKASLTRVELRDPYNLKHKMKLAELQALTPTFSFKTFFAAAGLPVYPMLNVTEPAFFKALEVELKAHDLKTWQSYLRWHLVRMEAPFLSRAFVDADFEFNLKFLRGVAEISPRWKRCVALVDGLLGEALGQLFVAKTFSADTKQRALAMTLAIEEAMADDVQQLPWMGPETKKRALEKLKGMANKIGYPDVWRDYSAFAVARGDFFGNVARGVSFETDRQLRKIGQPLDRKEWLMSPPTVNAYYDAQKNDMNFPAGVLQPPLFDPKLDDAPNFGNTGATIGHELTHGFDDEGRKFDAAGNLHDWWGETDGKEFERRAACVSDQYSQYTVVDDIKINGKLTLGEDLADLGGTLLAYNAWKAATRGQKLEPIDGLTPDQRFFVGMAQWACSNTTPEELRMRATIDPHSPERYRVNGVVANMPEFKAAFACKAGQPLVNEPVCRVW